MLATFCPSCCLCNSLLMTVERLWLSLSTPRAHSERKVHGPNQVLSRRYLKTVSLGPGKQHDQHVCFPETKLLDDFKLRPQAVMRFARASFSFGSLEPHETKMTNHTSPMAGIVSPRLASGFGLVRVFVFLLSGLFCCLGFSGVMFFAVWAGACSFFCCLGGGPGPAQTAKKKHPAQTAKKKNTPPPLPSVFFFCCLGGWVCLCFCCLGGGRVFFCSLGGWRVLFFAVCAGGVFFFLLFGRGACSFFCCLGRGRVLFFAVWAGDGSSLTYRSAWLVFKRPNNKKDQTAKKKKKNGFRLWAFNSIQVLQTPVISSRWPRWPSISAQVYGLSTDPRLELYEYSILPGKCLCIKSTYEY